MYCDHCGEIFDPEIIRSDIFFNRPHKVIDELEKVKWKVLPEISSYVKKEFVVKEFDNQINELKGKVE